VSHAARRPLRHGDHAAAAGDDHNADVNQAHEAHDAHEPAHAKPLPFAPTDSPWLITVPLLILGLFSIIAGYINAAAFKTNFFDRWIESSIGVEVPDGGEFKWVNAMPSIIMIAPASRFSLAVCVKLFGPADSKLRGLTRRNAVFGAGYQFLVNKYYLDYLYEKVIVHAIAHRSPRPRIGRTNTCSTASSTPSASAGARPAIGSTGTSTNGCRRRRQRQRQGRSRHRWGAAARAIRQGQHVTARCCSAPQPSVHSYSYSSNS